MNLSMVQHVAQHLTQILEAADLEQEETLTVARASAKSAAVSGVLVVFVDDPAGLANALRHYPPEHRVRIFDEALECRDATVADALSQPASNVVALVVDPIAPHLLQLDPLGVRGVIDRLRDPIEGCPWDNAQTHESLRPHLLEETYEVLEAIAAGDPTELCEELGDVMMQVVLHAKLAEQAGQFTLDDVAEGIRAKLVRRHPHVFGDGSADTPKLVEGAWERLKAKERPSRASVLDGVPKTLPVLARAQSILGRAERNGFAREQSGSDDLGEQLLNLVQAARASDRSAEDALRDALTAFEQQVRADEAGRSATPE